MEPGTWNLELGHWILELGTWNLEPGTWNLELGTWGLDPGTWNLELGTWNLELETWNLEPWNLELPRTKSLELGGLELGTWSLDTWSLELGAGGTQGALESKGRISSGPALESCSTASLGACAKPVQELGTHRGTLTPGTWATCQEPWERHGLLQPPAANLWDQHQELDSASGTHQLG